MRSLFSSEISGVECVLKSSSGNSETFEIINGEPRYKVVADAQRPELDDEALSIQITKNFPFCNHISVEYELVLYPTREFYEGFSTANPTIAWVGSLIVMLFTSLLFLVYDRSVRKEMRDNQVIIEAKRSFLRFISHEVRTPLNTVTMGLEAICHDIEEFIGGDESGQSIGSEIVPVQSTRAAKLMDLAREISVSAESAVEILNDVLSYDKVEHGSLNLELTLVPIVDLLSRIMSEFKVPADAKSIQLDRSFVDAEWMKLEEAYVVADKVRLAQVMRNLFSNAVKFTPDGGTICLMVCLDKVKLSRFACTRRMSAGILEHGTRIGEFDCCQERGHIKISLKDSGVGLSQKQIDAVFEQGVQFNANALQEGKGSGLGLFIAKGIVEQHGGNLLASSEGDGRGSTFSLSFPVFSTFEENKPKDENILIPAPTIADTSTLFACERHETNVADSDSNSPKPQPFTVLIVDDDPMNRKLLSMLLTRRGWTCDCAEDGRIAVDLVKNSLASKNPYTSIILDYEMPNLNGPDAATRMRELGCTSCMVGLTGNVLPDDISYFIGCGVERVFGKPVKLEELNSYWRQVGVFGVNPTVDESAV